MPDEPIGAGAAAPSAPAESSSAPASTPSTPSTSEPTSQPTPATLSESVNRAAQAAEKRLTDEGAARDAQRLQQSSDYTKEQEAKDAPPVVQPPDATKQPEAKPTEAAKPAEAAANPLDKLGNLSAEKITEALKDAPPELTKFLADKGLTVDALAENARAAAELPQFKEIFPTIDSAKTAMEGANNFFKLDQQFPAIKTGDDYNKFMMETLVPMSLILDEKGQPIPDPNIPGAFKNDGSVGRFIKMTTDTEFQNVQKLADMLVKGAKTDDERNQAEDLVEALKFVSEFRENGYKFTGPKTETAALPQDVQDRLSRAEKIEQDNNAREQQQRTQAFETREQKIIEQTHAKLSPLIKDILDKTALNDKLKTFVTEKVWTETQKLMDANNLYKQERDKLNPSAADYDTRRVGTNANFMKPVLLKILEDVVGEVGGQIVKQNQDLHGKIATQTETARMEPRTGSTTVQAHPPAASQEDLGAKALEMARKEHGPNVQPGSREWYAALTKLKGISAA